MSDKKTWDSKHNAKVQDIFYREYPTNRAEFFIGLTWLLWATDNANKFYSMDNKSQKKFMDDNEMLCIDIFYKQNDTLLNTQDFEKSLREKLAK